MKRTQEFQESSQLRETVNEMRSYDAAQDDAGGTQLVEEFGLFHGLQDKKSPFS